MKRRVCAPQIILDHAAGSPEAVWAIDIANKFINDTWGDPSEEQWPVLDRLARNHFQLLSPGVKICAALAIVHLHAGRPLSAADKALVERLVLNSNPTNKGHLLGVIKVIWLGLGSPEVAEDFAFKAVREEPEGTFAKKLLEVGVALRISRLQAAARPDSAQFDQALPELIDDMTKVAKGNGSTFDPWGELAPTLAWLIDRRRQLDGRYPANEYSAAIAKFQLPARGAPSYERSLRELLNMARAERLTSVFNRTGVEALGQAAVGGNGDKEVARLLWDSASTEYPRWWRPNNKDQYGYEKWPGSYNDSRLNLRFALHERADALAACFLWLRHAPENDLVKLSHRVVELAIENSGKQRLPGTQLLGRDLALGGLGTRALLALHELQPTEIDLQHTTLNEKAESWALGVAALPAALPPKAVLDQLAAIAIDEKKSAAVRRAVTLGLGAATEAVFHDAADSIGSIAWRRHALGLLARHAEKIPVDTTGWPENLVPHAGKFLTARVAWELSRLDAPALPPAERAAPLVKELGPLAASLAFLARTEFTTSAKLPATVERQLLLEPDPDFAPALLRAASTLPDQEPLIARYLGAGAPKNSTEWSKLAEGRSWW